MSRLSNKSLAATLATSKDEDFEIQRRILWQLKIFLPSLIDLGFHRVFTAFTSLVTRVLRSVCTL
jgi:hypothetical protein